VGSLFISSEHGGNLVPKEYRSLFRGAKKELTSHRGYDHGSLELARFLAKASGASLVATRWTRLLVEVNRSPGHRRLFSEFTHSQSAEVKRQIVARYYEPHRRRVEEMLTELVEQHPPVVHVGVHTFTPRLAGQMRTAEMGLLYDPARSQEQAFCIAWSRRLKLALPELRVRRNYPYLGKSDGLVTYLRRLFPPRKYLAIELEVNQLLPLGAKAPWKRIQHHLAESLIATCEQFDS
jgi:predicted N-formylglutamate amidohydrolase